MGVDSYPTVTCIRYGSWVAPFIAWRTSNQDESGDKIKDLVGGLDYERLFVDATGPGEGLPHQLRRKGMGRITAVKVGKSPTAKARTAEGDSLGDFTDIRDQLLWSLREWLRADINSMIPDDALLEAELIAVSWKGDGGKVKCEKKDSIRRKLGGRSTDRMDALSLTRAEGASILIGMV